MPRLSSPRPGAARRRAGTIVVLVSALALMAGPAWAAWISSTAVTASFTASSSFPNYSQTVIAEGPTSYFRQDDSDTSTTATNSVSGASGAYTSPLGAYRNSASPGGGGSISFPGGSSNSGAYSDASSAPTVVTQEIWFKTTTTAGGKLLSFGGNQTGNSFANDRGIWMANDGSLHYFAGSSSNKVDGTTAYNDGQWHQAAASVGAAGVKLYVDGVLKATNTNQTSAQTYSGYWRIGGDTATLGPSPSSYYFTGQLADASVFTTQLSDARVTAHYNARTSSSAYVSAIGADSPWAFWRLADPSPESGSSTVMADSSGSGHPGHIVNVPANSPVGGVAGALSGGNPASTAFRFNGVGNGYDTTRRTNPGYLTYEVWIKTSTTTGGEIIAFGDSATGNSSSIDRILYMRADGRISFGVNSNLLAVSPNSYNDGAWHYVVATYGSGGEVLYVDGASVASNSSNPGTAFSGYFRWGGDNIGSGWAGNPSTYLTGTLDEVAVYPFALDASRVRVHYYAANR